MHVKILENRSRMVKLVHIGRSCKEKKKQVKKVKSGETSNVEVIDMTKSVRGEK